MGFTGGSYFQPPANLTSVLEADKVHTAKPATKLVCTIGPSCGDRKTLGELLMEGMSIARFDFSYGTAEWHQEHLDNLRGAVDDTKTLCAVMLDTTGPEVVVINRQEEATTLEAGQQVIVSCDKTVQTAGNVITISYPTFEGIGLNVGSSLFIGLYLFSGSETSSVYLTVQEVQENRLVCVANNAAVLSSGQLIVHMAGIAHNLPILTEGDKQAIAGWGVANSIDFVAVSFCSGAEDVEQCRAFLDSVGLTHTQIVAKIENREGLIHYEEILDVADAICMSRGSLGICLEAQQVFWAQKMLLKACNMAGKPVFVTRVVDTMVDAPRPTRAEATDVANLVLDCCDGIVLGAETFRGKYVRQAVQTVLACCRQGELCFDNYEFYRTMTDYMGGGGAQPNMCKSEALASTAVRCATKSDAALIVVFTVTGRSARLLAKFRPLQPILAVVSPDKGDPNDAEAAPKTKDTIQVPLLTASGLQWSSGCSPVVRRCHGYRGVLPICADASLGNPDGAFLDSVITYAKEAGLVKSGDRVVVSMCPRIFTSDLMSEAGVLKVVVVE